MIKAPCKGCQDHHRCCQDTCQKPEYLAYREDIAAIRKYREDCRMMGDYVHRRRRKSR